MDPLSDRVIAILRDDPLRWHLLDVVAGCHLPDCWIGAGFVRNAVWDHLHGLPAARPDTDIDVIWFDSLCATAEEDRRIEAILRAQEPSFAWSVKNQARMHGRNGDAPFRSATDAMCFWPETATAIAVCRIGKAGCKLAAPLGLFDLFELKLRPTARFITEKRGIYEDRAKAKDWLSRWPQLQKS